MYDDFGGDYGDFYDGDDLEALGQQESFEHAMSERYADIEDDDLDGDDFEDDFYGEDYMLDTVMEGRMMGEY